MPDHELPERPSLEYLKKLARERQRAMRRDDPGVTLSVAQLAIAREYGFRSWRALKTEVDRRRAPDATAFFAACRSGDVEVVRELLQRDTALVRARTSDGATALHLAVRHPEILQELLGHGADPNARDAGDHALPLHFAAGGGHVASARLLLDAGSDVHGAGDLHELEVIGWATVFAEAHRDVVHLLVEHGARHHVFSAIALGDRELLAQVVAADRTALARRLSRFEQRQTALHYVIAPADGLVGGLFRTGDHYHTLDLLIELGADLEAQDARGRTPLAVAMLLGDREAMRRLYAAGAREPEPPSPPSPAPGTPSALASSMGVMRIMVAVPDIAATVAWYESIGFQLVATNGEPGAIDWAFVKFGEAELMFASSGDPWRASTSGVSLWINTERLDELYALLKERQFARARAALAGEPADAPAVRFASDLHTAFYGQREFCIVDPNGVHVNFCQPVK